MCTSNSTGSFFFFFFLVALIDIYQNRSDFFFKTIIVEIQLQTRWALTRYHHNLQHNKPASAELEITPFRTPLQTVRHPYVPYFTLPPR